MRVRYREPAAFSATILQIADVGPGPRVVGRRNVKVRARSITEATARIAASISARERVERIAYCKP